MRWLVNGVIDSDCTPPAISTRSMPEPICADALPIAVSAARAVPVHRLAGNVIQPGGVSGIAREIATTVMRFGEDDVVDVRGVHAGPADDLGQHRGDQRLGRGVDQRPLERTADGCPGGTDDDGCGHVLNLGFRR